MLRRALLPCLLALAVVPTAAQAGPVATAAKTCGLSAKEKGGSKPSSLGATYVTSLSASGTSCGKAKGVVKAFNSCRKRSGKKGRCSGKVKGYSCSEKRSSSPVQFNSSVSCKNGGKSVKFSITQNT